jgi:hypothetical protein
MPSDFNRDEVRRQVRDIDATNRAVMTRWRSALQELINPDSKLSTDEKHALLGVPSRRGFFKIGGVTLLGATVLAACGSDDEDPAETGTAPSTTAAAGGSDGEASGEGNLDVTLAKTAASVENLAVAAYQTAIDSGIVTDATIGAAAAAFRDHHQAHADAINGVVTGAGAEAITDPNSVLFDALVQPVLDAGPTQDSLVQLAYDLETAAVQAYAFAGGNLSTPALRSTIMTIGGVESRHAAVLKMLAQGDPGPGVFYDGAFISAADPGIPDEALIS